MTCFWKGILNGLNKYIFSYNLRTQTPRDLIYILKKYAIITTNVTCNGKYPKYNQLKENLKSIHELDINKIYDGYQCSAFDPYLFLVSQLFIVNIEHDLMSKMQKINSTLKETKIKYIFNNSKKPIETLYFRSTLTHFEVI